MAKKKTKRRPSASFRVNIAGNPAGKFTIWGNSRKKAIAAAQKFAREHGMAVSTGKRKNIEMGFWAGGSFHPIRASKDYHESRVSGGSWQKFSKRKKKYPRMGGRGSR
jgi:hypothetical protein